jgi:hypothetical protein
MVSTSGISFKVKQGDSLMVPVSVSLIGGNPSRVALSLFEWKTKEGSILDAANPWFSTEFNPSIGTPPFSST